MGTRITYEIDEKLLADFKKELDEGIFEIKSVKFIDNFMFINTEHGTNVSFRKLSPFRFDELSKEVQERIVKDKMEEGTWEDYHNDELNEILSETLINEGFKGLDLFFQLAHCQGDFVSFYGNIDIGTWLVKNKKNLEKHTYINIFDEITNGLVMEIQKTYGRYENYRSMLVTNTDECCSDSDSINDLKHMMQEDCVRVSKLLQKEGYEYIEGILSEEYVRDNFLEGESLFDINGVFVE